MRSLLVNRTNGIEAERSVIGDVGGNGNENDASELVRRHYKAALAPLPKPRVVDPALPEPVHSVNNMAAVEAAVQPAPKVPSHRSHRIQSYYALQEWEGYVVAIGSEKFTADLVDVTRGAQTPA